MATLVGSVVRLEPLAPRHTEGLFALLGRDDEAWRWMIVRTPQELSDMTEIVNGYLADQLAGEREPYAVIDLASERVVGTSSFMDISKKDRTVEIGSTIYAREFWRTKVNTESKLLLLTQAFEVEECIRVCFKTDSLNTRSQRAIQRIGATFEGRFRSHKIRSDGTIRDSMYYSIIEDEWPTVKAKLQAMLG
jgi:RimJ/RimL family protein N-acetyltransferase